MAVPVPRQNAIHNVIWGRYTIGKHGVALLTPVLNPVSKVCKGASHRLYQEVNLYF